MRVKNLKHAKELGLEKWEILACYDFDSVLDVCIFFEVNYPHFFGLEGLCGFCEYYDERKSRYKHAYPCPLAENKRCDKLSACCNGLYEVWHYSPTAENAKKIYEFIKKVEV